MKSDEELRTKLIELIKDYNETRRRINENPEEKLVFIHRYWIRDKIELICWILEIETPDFSHFPISVDKYSRIELGVESECDGFSTPPFHTSIECPYCNEAKMEYKESGKLICPDCGARKLC